jgi:predicted deacylase
MRAALSACVFVALLLVQVFAQSKPGDRAVFTVGTVKASRGQTATGAIEVPAGSDAAMSIPIAVAHGAKAGPVLALLAGAHGTEYATIIALEKLIAEIDATQLTGTVIILPLVNVPSFQKVVPHLNPTDGKNMNRMYPGKMDGTQTDRASYLITQVVEQADHVIDFHGGDIDESLRPYSYWNKTGKTEQDAFSRGMVLAFGLDHIIISADRPKDPKDSRYFENTASTRRKPSITVEAGHAGTVESDDVAVVLVNGSLSVMRHLRCCQVRRSTENPVWVDHLADVAAEQGGIFYPLVKRGSYIGAGMKIGYVTDYVGKMRCSTRARKNLVRCAVACARFRRSTRAMGSPASASSAKLREVIAGGSKDPPLLHREDPHRAALRNFRIISRQKAIESRLHRSGIDAPSREHGDVLLAIDRERCRLAGDARVRRELPHQFAGGRIERVKLPIVGAAAEHEAAAGGEHRSPIRRRPAIGVCPHALAGIDVPRLHFANVIGAFRKIERAGRARVAAAGRTWRPADDGSTSSRWRGDHPRLRARRSAASFSHPSGRTTAYRCPVAAGSTSGRPVFDRGCETCPAHGRFAFAKLIGPSVRSREPEINRCAIVDPLTVRPCRW